MHNDDFEELLARQPMRAPPPEWRDQVLSLATAQATTSETASAKPDGWMAGLRLVLARVSPAWSALGLVWLVIIGANAVMSGSNSPSSAATPAVSFRTWTRHRAEFTRLIDSVSEPQTHEAERPSEEPNHRSRSRTQIHWHLGRCFALNDYDYDSSRLPARLV